MIFIFSTSYAFTQKNIKKLDLCLFFGFCLNVCKRIKESDYYVSIYFPHLSNMYQITTYSSKISYGVYENKLITFVNNMYLYNYIIYLKLDIENNNISLIHHISPNLISLMSHIYNKNKFLNILLVYEYRLIFSVIKFKIFVFLYKEVARKSLLK